MGLDAWLKSVDARAKLSELKVDGAFSCDTVVYWRKNEKVNNYVCVLHIAKGGNADSFNCSDTFLNEEELLGLRKLLPLSEVKYIDDAIDEIKKGKLIFYACWW